MHRVTVFALLPARFHRRAGAGREGDIGASEVKALKPDLTAGQVVAFNPDLVLASTPEIARQLATDLKWREVPAVAAGKVYPVPGLP